MATLQARLGQNSTNSAPALGGPSSDPPGPVRPPAKRDGRRRPGGQPGHRGFCRTLRPVEEVDQVVAVLPEACARCGTALPADAEPGDPPDVRHQVVELPPVQVTVTEYQLAARSCPGCGQLTRATWPARLRRARGDGATACGSDGGADGPLPTLEAGSRRLPGPPEAGAEVADGTVSAVEQLVSAALAPVVAEARAAVQDAAVANLDETGWPASGGTPGLAVDDGDGDADRVPHRPLAGQPA